jgi:predicted amidohydrolase
MRIAAVQHDIVWEDKDANFARLAPMIAGAAAAGADLVLLTETFSTGFSMDPSVREPVGGASSQFLVSVAAEHGVWVAGTCPEVPDDAPANDTRPHNSFVLASPDGTVHRYQKIHPFTYGGEAEHFRPGNDFVTVTIAGLRCSLFTCYDLRFANEFWQRAELTDVYLVPANWPGARRRHWKTLLRARAIENQAYVVGCNRVGEGGGLAYTGDSCIIDPLGELLATGAGVETTLIAEVTAEHVAGVRDRFRFIADRRS